MPDSVNSLALFFGARLTLLLVFWRPRLGAIVELCALRWLFARSVALLLLLNIISRLVAAKLH